MRRIIAFASKVVRGLFRHHAFDHAATMAFYFFLGTIPLLVVAGLLVGQVVQSEGVSTVAAPMYRVLPAVMGGLIQQELETIAQADPGSVAPLSALGFLWLTSNGFHNLMDVFELLVGAKPRSWMRQRAIAVVWVVITLAAVTAAAWFLIVAAHWRSAGVMLVFAVLATLGLAAFYRMAVAHPKGVRRRVWAGTLTAMVLWVLVSWGFGNFVGSVGRYSVYYGGLAAVAITLLWFYLTSLAFVIGAEVNAQLEGIREPRPSPAL